MFWTIMQTVLLAVTAGVVFWYTLETKRTREEMVKQTELSLTPFITAWRSERFETHIDNVGNGPAIGVRVLPVIFDESIGKIVDIAWDISLLVLNEEEVGIRVEIENGPAQITAYLMQQRNSDPPINLTLWCATETETQKRFFDNLNALLIQYLDIIDRRFSRVILWDKNGDYLRQVDYKSFLPTRPPDKP